MPDVRRRVLLTGGAGGIGSACARLFAAQGNQVLVTDIDGAAAEAAARDLGVDFAAMDVTDEDSVARVISGLDTLDVVVHTAGVVGQGHLVDLTLDQWRRVMDVSLTGAFLLARATIPLLRRSAAPPAKLVFLSSVNAATGGSALSSGAYAAAKAGIEGLTRHLARALAPAVDVNAVAPGPVQTPMLDRLGDKEIDELSAAIPAGRVATADEVAALVGFLASPLCGFVTGAVVPQNGGQWM